MGWKNRGSKGSGTLVDILSPEIHGKLLALQKELARKAEHTIEKQLQTIAADKPRIDHKPIRVTTQAPVIKTNRPLHRSSTRPTPPAPIANPKSRGYSLVKPKVTIKAHSPAVPETIRGSKAKLQKIKPQHTEPFRYWDLPLEASVRENPPTRIKAADRADFESVLAQGSVENARDLLDLHATIGLDFGTSSTKVIVRFPYEAGEPSVAIPAPRHCLSDDNDYLWQTVLWLRSDGEFLPWPEKGARVLYSLKQGIMGSQANLPCTSEEYRGLKVRRTDAATAYLAFVVRYVRGWLRINRPEILRARYTRWFVNLGLPAENADNSRLSNVYRRVAAAAVLAAIHDGPIDIEVTNIFLEDKRVISAGNSTEEAATFGIAVIAETAAEAAGFAKSNQSAPDLYLMVDVGAMTLDVCTFRLHRLNGGEDQYALLNGMVRPLGVEAMHWFLGQGKSDHDFRLQCQQSFRQVVWTTKKDKDPNARCWKQGNDLPIFLVGGGAKSHTHRELVEALAPWLRQHTGGEGVRFLSLPPLGGIDCPKPLFDFGRMAVAWGLSYPEDQIGKILPLSKSENVPALGQSGWADGFISKDQV